MPDLRTPLLSLCSHITVERSTIVCLRLSATCCIHTTQYRRFPPPFVFEMNLLSTVGSLCDGCIRVQAVNLDPCHGDSYRVRGQIYLAQENYNSAIVAFSQANGIDKDVASFAGDVGCGMLRLCGFHHCRERLAGV
jgi:hypothetical protein